MIDVTVKTLDSQNHVFSVEEDISVRQFKEQISPTISIPVEQQRLIFRGRVLQDDKKISEYNVANNTVHVVQRPENQNNTANDEPPARPSSQAGRDGGGLFISDDGVGRNAIIMGAIGVPAFDMEGHDHDHHGHHGPPVRRSGAQIRLMVGNQMLNRASTLLQQLEDDDAAVAAAAAAATASSSPSDSSSASGSGDLDSPENDVDALLSNEGAMEIDDDPGSIERMINQVVNVSSAAAILTAFRQGQGGAQGGPNPPSASPPSTTQPSASNTASAPPPTATTDPTTISSTTPTPTIQPSNTNTPQNPPSTPSRRPESPRIRELGTALQDYLALQDRLTPFLRFLQDALRQNQVYTEEGEALSTQYVYDTVSSVLHLLGHSLHAFSEILCDFNLPPDDRRLTASSSILVEQSTVVRATIPMAFSPQNLLAQAQAQAHAQATAVGAAATAAANASANNGGAQPQGGVAPQPPSTGGIAAAHFTPTPFSTGIPGLSISVSAAPGVPGMQNFPMAGIPINIPGLPTGIAGIIPTQMNSQWTNPNAAPATNNSTSNSTAGQGQGQQPSAPAPPSSSAPQNTSNGPTPMQLPGGAMLPPGLQNLGALLGAGGAGGLANLFGGGGGAAGGGGVGVQMQMPAGMQNPFMNLQQFQMAMGGNNNNNNSAVRNQQQPASATPTTAPPSGQGQASRPTANGTASGAGTGQGNNGGGNNMMTGGSFQNLLRNELSRPQFDPLLPCHTYHSTGGRTGRSGNAANRARPAEFRRFVNVEDGASMEAAQNRGSAEGETVEILIDLVRNSRIIDLLQPVLKDVVLNYLMRGRDPKNPAHLKTCAKGLVKKLLPFLEQFSSKVGGANESVDIGATYTNILTGCITSMIKSVLGQSPGGDGQLKSEIINSLTELQKQLIQVFKVCYPNSTNVGLLFVNYVVERCLGGTSILFKNQARQKLIDHLKQLETRLDPSASPSFIVYKETPATTSVATPPPTQTQSPSTASTNEARSGSSIVNNIGKETAPRSTPVQPSPKTPTTTPINLTSDDVDIDEVLQLPPSMVAVGPQQGGASARRCPHPGGAGAQGHSNQTDSIVSLMRSLPSEWADTIQQDIRRQVEMPSQPSFSPGYNTLFPRKH